MTLFGDFTTDQTLCSDAMLMVPFLKGTHMAECVILYTLTFTAVRVVHRVVRSQLMFGYCVRTYQVPVFSTAVPQDIGAYAVLHSAGHTRNSHPTAAAMCPTTDTALSMQCYFYEMS